MKMNKTILLVMSLVVISIAAYFLITGSDNSSSIIDIRDRQFSVEEREDIEKIFIAQRNGRQLIFEKMGGQWNIDGKYDAHPNVMENLLDVLCNLRMKYIPPPSSYENIYSAIGRLGIKVEVYGKNNELLKAYQVGGTTSGELGTIFIMDGYQQPYVMEMPNFEGSLRGRFLFDNVDQLRDRTIFDYDQKEIKSITIDYPKDQKSSFKLDLSNEKPEISRLLTDGYLQERQIKDGTVERFLRGFKDLDAEAFENQHELKDSIKNLLPIAKIRLEDFSGGKKEISLHALLDVFNSGINTRVVNIDKRVERYFVDCDWGDFMLAQHLLLSKILWKHEEFFEI
jgi:hypothetical protein